MEMVIKMHKIKNAVYEVTRKYRKYVMEQFFK